MRVLRGRSFTVGYENESDRNLRAQWLRISAQAQGSRCAVRKHWASARVLGVGNREYSVL